MTATPQRRFQASERRQQVADLYLQGWKQSAIAAQLQIAQSTVSADIHHLEEQWRQSGIRNLDLVREIELQKLDRLEREAWAAWERSQKPAQSAVVTGEGPGQQTRKAMKNQIGDPRFLEQVNKCIAQRRTLLGLDAPTAVDVTLTRTESTSERQLRLQQIFLSLVPPPAIPTTPGSDELPAISSALPPPVSD